VSTDTIALIGAIAGVVAALAGVIALWAVFRRFKLSIRARIDERRQAIRVDLKNKGRASGQVSEVAVIDQHLVDLDPQFFGLDGDRFRSARLPKQSSWFLIIRDRSANREFPPDARVRVRWGKRKKRDLVPEQVSATSYYGDLLKSEWPEHP
jgi:hypothetical protein